MTDIAFERIRRECPFNAKLPAGSRLTIYDWNVLIDGVRRACFHKWSRSGHEYELRDTDHRPIGGSGHLGLRTRKAGFVEAIRNALDLIPTPEQIDQRHWHEAEQQALALRQQAEADRIERIQRHGEVLLQACKLAHAAMMHWACMPNDERMRKSEAVGETLFARAREVAAAIAKAEGRDQ